MLYTESFSSSYENSEAKKFIDDILNEMLMVLLLSTQERERGSEYVISFPCSPCGNEGLVRSSLSEVHCYCVDYTAMNKITKKDAYPIPPIIGIVHQLQNSAIFSTPDLN